MMASDVVPILLVTANVGSIFEAPNDMLKVWCEEFLSIINRLNCKFIGLHCQEVGGKNYEKSMKHVENFVNILMSSNELRLFDKIQVFLDEDYSSVEHFTALGNLYFIHNSIEDVLIWDFKKNIFLPVRGKEIHSGNIESVATKEKSKFPQDFFPECKWSRKGFLKTRWSLNGTIFDLINIHLFHDASNFVAMETSPSVYSKNRKRALKHSLERFGDSKIPYFLFGDFNFRTDTNSVVKKVTEGLNTNRVQNNKNNDHTKIQYTNDEDELILCIGKKEFSHSDLSCCKKSSMSSDPSWLKEFDKEVEQFGDYVTEFSSDFPPSYPFEEDLKKPSSYMPTRCPSWCDRVLISHRAKELIVTEEHPVEYNLMGVDTCMGDHKPVYLSVSLKSHAGTVSNSCNCRDSHFVSSSSTPSFSSSTPHFPLSCQRCGVATVSINITDMSDHLRYAQNYDNNNDTDATSPLDSKLLHEPITKDMLTHEPYTPESAESHSPMPEKTDDTVAIQRKAEAVSSNLLKTKLEYVILEAEQRNRSNGTNAAARSKSDFSDAETATAQRCAFYEDLSASTAHVIEDVGVVKMERCARNEKLNNNSCEGGILSTDDEDDAGREEEKINDVKEVSKKNKELNSRKRRCCCVS